MFLLKKEDSKIQLGFYIEAESKLDLSAIAFLVFAFTLYFCFHGLSNL